MQEGSDRFRLVVRRGPTPGQSWDLEGELITVGRDINNDIVINDVESSRQHLRLRRRRGGGYVLEDLGSTNGTFVNGQRLGGARTLQNGDMVGLGETVTLAYERVPGAEGVPAGGNLWSPETTEDAPDAADELPLPAVPEPAPSPASEQGAAAPKTPEPAAPDYDDYDPYAQPEEEPPGNSLRWLGIGCGALLLLCCCLSVALVVLIDQACLWNQVPLLSEALDALGFYMTC